MDLSGWGHNFFLQHSYCQCLRRFLSLDLPVKDGNLYNYLVHSPHTANTLPVFLSLLPNIRLTHFTQKLTQFTALTYPVHSPHCCIHSVCLPPPPPLYTTFHIPMFAPLGAAYFPNCWLLPKMYSNQNWCQRKPRTYTCTLQSMRISFWLL